MTQFEEIDDQKITAIIDGEEKECDVLFTYDSENEDYTFVGYTDNTKDSEGKLNIYTGKYSIFNKKELEPVTDPEEIAMLDGVIKQIIENYK